MTNGRIFIFYKVDQQKTGKKYKKKIKYQIREWRRRTGFVRKRTNNLRMIHDYMRY